MKTKESIALCIQQNYMFNAILYTTFNLSQDISAENLEDFLIKIHYTCEKSAIEINETENF